MYSIKGGEKGGDRGVSRAVHVAQYSDLNWIISTFIITFGYLEANKVHARLLFPIVPVCPNSVNAPSVPKIY
jgi:hypothetical protein